MTRIFFKYIFFLLLSFHLYGQDLIKNYELFSQNFHTQSNQAIESKIQEIKNILNKESLNNYNQARLRLIYSQITGQYAQKKQSLNWGNISYQALKQATTLMPHHFHFVKAYAKGVITIKNKNYLTRKLIEKYFSISIEKENLLAINYLQQFDRPEAIKLMAQLK